MRTGVLTSIGMMLLSFSMTVSAGVTWEADSGDWYHSERVAISMAKTRAKNGVYQYCRENDARLDGDSWDFDGLGGSHCDTKARKFDGSTVWNCTVRATADCYSRN